MKVSISFRLSRLLANSVLPPVGIWSTTRVTISIKEWAGNARTENGDEDTTVTTIPYPFDLALYFSLGIFHPTCDVALPLSTRKRKNIRTQTKLDQVCRVKILA